ncbi:MAG: hypothetical protein CM15mP120_13450 [Pseudomonadota bacterium]|nr:MAG: hypothetical protein CM15mP120_13450 [Pseudomonadota bacterium]
MVKQYTPLSPGIARVLARVGEDCLPLAGAAGHYCHKNVVARYVFDEGLSNRRTARAPYSVGFFFWFIRLPAEPPTRGLLHERIPRDCKHGSSVRHFAVLVTVYCADSIFGALRDLILRTRGAQRPPAATSLAN